MGADRIIAYAIFLVGVPVVGVVLARVTGSLTPARGAIGAAALPFALSAAQWLLDSVHRQSPLAREFYPTAAVWIVESAVVGALTALIWRAADRRRGLDTRPTFDRRR